MKDGRTHAEVVRGHDVAYGSPLRLMGVEVEDLVMLRLSHGGYLPIEGATLRERAFEGGRAGKAWKVRRGRSRGRGRKIRGRGRKLCYLYAILSLCLS